MPAALQSCLSCQLPHSLAPWSLPLSRGASRHRHGDLYASTRSGSRRRWRKATSHPIRKHLPVSAAIHNSRLVLASGNKRLTVSADVGGMCLLSNSGQLPRRSDDVSVGSELKTHESAHRAPTDAAGPKALASRENSPRTWCAAAILAASTTRSVYMESTCCLIVRVARRPLLARRVTLQASASWLLRRLTEGGPACFVSFRDDRRASARIRSRHVKPLLDDLRPRGRAPPLPRRPQPCCFSPVSTALPRHAR